MHSHSQSDAPTRGTTSVRELYHRLRLAEDLLSAIPVDADVLLVWRDEEGRLQTFAASDAISIGRDSKNDVVLSSPSVSRHHCRLSRLEKEWEIEDSNSSNGTYVNGARIDRCRLRAGDIIDLGGRALLFVGEKDSRSKAA